MSTGPSHYLAAEQLLSQASFVRSPSNHKPVLDPQSTTLLLARAQVHATLALAAATAMAADHRMSGLDFEAWDAVCGVQEDDDADAVAAAEADAASRFRDDAPAARPFAPGNVVNIADTNHPHWGLRVVVADIEPVSGNVIVGYPDGSVHAYRPAQLMHSVAFAARPREYFDEAEADDVRAIRREMADEAGEADARADAEWAAEGFATAMSASERYEYDRDAEFALDAADDERNAHDAENEVL